MRKIAIHLAAAFFSASLTLAASDVTIEVDPKVPAPDKAFSITVSFTDTVGCFEPPRLEVNGRAITVAFNCFLPGPSAVPPGASKNGVDVVESVVVPPLDAGVYALEVLQLVHHGYHPFPIDRMPLGERTINVWNPVVPPPAIEPPAPTSDDEVTLVVTVPDFYHPMVQRTDRVIYLQLEEVPPPAPLPTAVQHFPLGLLDPGDYQLTVVVEPLEGGPGQLVFLESFSVREADAGDLETVLLAGDAYAVSARWTRPDGSTGTARGRRFADADDSASFYFFRPGNKELVVKVLPGCAVNGHTWVFAGGLTDLEVELEVVELATGTPRLYRNLPGTPFVPIQDTRAFACP